MTAREVGRAILIGAAIGLGAGALLMIASFGIVHRALARDGGQWSDQPAAVRKWFQGLMQPDNPAQSCCGEADAYEADLYEQEGDHYVAIITDGHGDIANGTRIPVPNFKMKWDQGNPTGHGVIFLSTSTTRSDPPTPGYVYVLWNGGNQARLLYCYVAPGGV